MAENMYRGALVVDHLRGRHRGRQPVTAPKPDAELVGLVYGCTPIPSEQHVPLWQRPIFWAGVVGAVFVALNVIFW